MTEILLKVPLNTIKHIAKLGASWSLDLQLPVQSVRIITKVVNSNPVHCEVYSIQYYVIEFISDLRQVSGFLRVLWFPPPMKLTAVI